MAQGPFAAAADSAALHGAFDLMVGEDRWVPRYLLGSFPLRFPHADETGRRGPARSSTNRGDITP